MLAPALLVLALGIVGHSVLTGRSFPARTTALAAKKSRVHMLYAWAAGIYAMYGLSAQLALIALDRPLAPFVMPDDLRSAGRMLGASGAPDMAVLPALGVGIAIGGVVAIAILILRRRRGKPPVGLRWRSPGAARHANERLPAAILALSAGVSEELFFRLLLPLLVVLVFGSAVSGFVVGVTAFALCHRHQGWVGMLAIGLLGVMLTGLYLLSGMLWVPMLLHVLIDLNAFILRPALSSPPTHD